MKTEAKLCSETQGQKAYIEENSPFKPQPSPIPTQKEFDSQQVDSPVSEISEKDARQDARGKGHIPKELIKYNNSKGSPLACDLTSSSM